MVSPARSSSERLEHSTHEATNHKINEIPNTIKIDMDILQDHNDNNIQNTTYDVDILELPVDIDEQVVEITNEGESIIQDGIVSIETNSSKLDESCNSEIFRLNDEKSIHFDNDYSDVSNHFSKYSNNKYNDNGYESMASPQSEISITSSENYWDDRLYELFPDLEF